MAAEGRKSFYTASEAARMLGISRLTLIRYETEGIFPKPMRNQVNDWRVYTQENIEALRRILFEKDA